MIYNLIMQESDLQDVCAWIDSESKVQASSFHALKSSVEVISFY